MKKIKHLPLFLVAFLFCLILGACAPVATQGQPLIQKNDYFIDSNNTIGQTFTSRHNGLTGIKVSLMPQGNLSGKLNALIYESPYKEELISSAPLDAEDIGTFGFTEILFNTPLSSYLENYYFELVYTGEGKIGVGAAELSTYLDGSLYFNGLPEAAQLAFIPIYQPLGLAWGLVKQIFEWILWLLLGGFLFILPGFAILSFFFGNHLPHPPLSKIALSAALSLSIYPIFFLFTSIIGMRLGFLYAILPGLVGLASLLYRWLRSGKRPVKIKFGDLFQKSEWVNIALFLVVGLIIFTRLWAMRTLPLPMWGDTIHHTMIAQLMLDHKGLFSSWEPYTELQSLNYHFGFHTAVAVFAWLTGMNSSQATLITGQIINILAVLAVFPLAYKVGNQNKWSGVAALLVAGLISSMPMFYINWSRYTQLAGQVIIPVLVWAIWEGFESGQFSWKRSIYIGILATGLAMTHYRVFFFFLTALPVIIVLNFQRSKRSQLIKALTLSGLVGGILFLPWFAQVFGGQLFKLFARQVANAPQAGVELSTLSNPIGDFLIYLPGCVWFLMVISLGVGLWLKNRGVFVICGWWLTLLLFENPSWVGIPVRGVLSNFAIFIAMYIPAGVLIGALVGWIAARFSNKWQAVAGLILTALTFLLGVGFSIDRIRDVRPNQFALATRADLRAADWIKENTLPEDRILVNSFFAYDNSVVVGSDAGWWLPILTERKISIPPMIYGAETGPFPDYPKYINDLRWLIEEKGYADPEVIAELKERGITYAYIGQQNGRVNYNGEVIMRAYELAESGYYKVVYHQDGVWVLKVE